MEARRTLKANLKLEHKPCGWCAVPLELGEDAAVCTACEKEHHLRCWDGKAGCATEGCANAPLRQLEPAAAAPRAAAALSPGMMRCPHCQAPLPEGTVVCNRCRGITSPDGVYHGPMVNAPGAQAALVYGILGLFICGVIFGPLAISKSNEAKRAMVENPTFGGGGMAQAGAVLGYIDIVVWGIMLIVRLSAIK